MTRRGQHNSAAKINLLLHHNSAEKTNSLQATQFGSENWLAAILRARTD
jgi:hypothetical protein